MPAQSPIELNDGVADKVFNPAGRDLKLSHVWRWIKANADGYKIGDEELSISNRDQPNGNASVRTLLKQPVVAVEEVNGLERPILLRGNRYDGTFQFHKESSEAERKAMRHLIGMLYLADVPADVGYFDKMVDLLEQVW